MAPGHILPMVDIANLFASRGARITILTTSVNAALIRPTIDGSINLHIIPFPYADFGLPEGCESCSFMLSDDQRSNFFRAIASLRHRFNSLLEDLRPDCVLTDIFFPWTYHIAAARGIPRLVFHGTSNFALCATNVFDPCLLAGKNDSFVLPGLPHRIEMLKTQAAELHKLEGTSLRFFFETLKEAAEVETKNYGAVMNSFYQLEPEYVDLYRKMVGRTWNIGPISLCNKEVDEKSSRGGEHPVLANQCLNWLENKAPGSVVYMCFGSESLFSGEQLREMAVGLEAAGHPFVWAVRNEGGDWSPEGYEERIEGKGMVIRGWAPQLLILNHSAVGGFVTHCGWNSSLEGISVGLPMVTWPLYAEQFYNEKLLVEVLKVGVGMGSKVWSYDAEARPMVKADAIEMARRSVEKNGSSFEELGKLLNELIELKKCR